MYIYHLGIKNLKIFNSQIYFKCRQNFAILGCVLTHDNRTTANIWIYAFILTEIEGDCWLSISPHFREFKRQHTSMSTVQSFRRVKQLKVLQYLNSIIQRFMNIFHLNNFKLKRQFIITMQIYKVHSYE